MDDLAERFEASRPRLRAIAYRVLGSLSEADDAVQETWLRLSRTEGIENLDAWLTTVVSRVALNMLRGRRDQPLGVEPIVDAADGPDPEHEALLADAVGLALLVVLETLSPAERVAFVLHDTFAVPFADIAAILDRSPDAVRQLASRARRRVRGTAPDEDMAAQREVVDAFLAAAREGDLDGLVAVLDPDVVLRADGREVRGAHTVARQALGYARLDLVIRPVLVNGVPGAVSTLHGRPFSLGAFTVRGGRIAAVDIVADRRRLAAIDLRL